jgi:16S rRNA (cytidine1402-2'-O)-methyltransferase
MSQGRLWVCATPIGNLGDVSSRLIETLSSVALIAAEDTRVTRVLLDRNGIRTPMQSLQKYNEAQRLDSIVAVLASGKDVALVSDAGTPNVSDPGALLVNHVRSAGFEVLCVPGPSALTAFLSISGVLVPPFYFGGFLPKKMGELETVLDGVPDGVPFVFFESGQRILKSLAVLGQLRDIADVVVAKELSKQFETCIQGSLDGVLTRLNEMSLKGEWCGLIRWRLRAATPVETIVSNLKAEGLTARQIRYVACELLHYPKNAVYHSVHHDD